LRNNGLVTGMIAGAAIGAMVVMAMTPELRKPVIRTAGDMGDRMRKMVNRRADQAEQMMDEAF
jgi:gas vesicle protein